MALKNPKVWFITGCSKGFGRELTRERLETTIDKVVITARKPLELKEKFQKS